MQSREDPRTVFIRANTTLAFGAGVQKPGSAKACDLADIHLHLPRRRPLRLNFGAGLGLETGSGAMGWKLNSVHLKAVDPERALLGAGDQQVALEVWGAGAKWMWEEVPYAPSGLAAGSLKDFVPGAEEAATRVWATTMGDELVLAFAAAPLDMVGDAEGFVVSAGRNRYRLELARRGREILRLI